jgi:hypothetical protein
LDIALALWERADDERLNVENKVGEGLHFERESDKILCMSSIFDGLSNISSLNSSVDLMKLAQQNSSGLNSTSVSTDPSTFRIQMEQSFNQMLNILIAPSDSENEENSSDPLAFLNNNNSDQSSLLTQNSSVSTILQQLNSLESNSTLLGRTVTYLDSASNEQKSAIVSKITFTSNLTPVLNLSNGDTIAVGAITSVSNS